MSNILDISFRLNGLGLGLGLLLSGFAEYIFTTVMSQCSFVPVNERPTFNSSTMNGPTLVICEPLCFVARKLGQIPAKRLKTILFEFYSGEQISSAKETLVKYIDNINPDKWIRPPKRRKDSVDNVGNKINASGRGRPAFFINVH